MTASPTPSVSGVAQVGRALIAAAGVWDEGVQLSYQWLRNSSPIQGAFGSSYFLTPRDAGAQISVEVTGRKTGFTTITRKSAEVAASWPEKVELVAIRGTAELGSILRVQTSELIASEPVTLQWERDGEPIAGATQDFFEVSSEDVGSTLTVRVQSATLASLPTAALTDAIEILGGAVAGDLVRTERLLTGFAFTDSPSVAAGATRSPSVSLVAGKRWFEQRTIRVFAPRSTALTNAQKAVVKRMVEENPTADKFICTGVRREGGTRAENIMIRLRAKSACDYAKLLNPELSTWYQSKVTKAPAYVGRVLMVTRGALKED
jgi:hypothetical protein